MKILMLTQWFDPEPTFKGLAFAHELQQQGHEVQVITGFPNYPGGKLYAGYKVRCLQKEEIDGVFVTRVPLYPSHDKSGFKRALNYISFAASSCIFGVFSAKRADVIYAYHPPLTVGMAAIVIGFFRRTPVVYDIQDMWPDTLQATGMLNNPRILSFIGKVCQWVYRRAAALVVLSPGFKELLVRRGVPEEKVSVIYNWCDAQALSGASAKMPVAMSGYFNIIFAGNMGKAQALYAVLEASKIVAHQNSLVQFVFIGGGVELDSLKKYAVSAGINNVIFLPRLPIQEIGAVLKSADVLLVHLRDDSLFEITVPSKTQAYMAVGKPLLMAVRGDAAKLVEDAKCGLLAEPENPDSIAKAVLNFAAMQKHELDSMGKRGSEFYQKNLSIKIGAKNFVDIFEKIREY